MGYYSDWTIEANPEPENLGELLEQYSNGYGFDYWDAGWHTNAKWYGSHADLERLSEALGNTVITVERIGEEAPDAERYELMNGEVIARWEQKWVSSE